MRDMDHYFPADARDLVYRMGKSEWCCFVPHPEDGKPSCHVRYRVLKEIDRSGYLYRSVITSIQSALAIDPANHGHGLVMCFFALARALATGPGLLDLDAPTCRALSHVKLDITPKAFDMPRPTLIVDFPAEWRDEVGCARDGPRYVLVAHDRRDIPVVINMETTPSGIMETAATSYMFGDESIEERIALLIRNDYPARSALLRVALNAALLARQVGLEMAGWCDPDMHALHERMADEKTRDPKTRARGEYLAGLDIRKYKFLQDVMPLIQADEGGTPYWSVRKSADGRLRPQLTRVRTKTKKP
jgi:hypothetical protein